MAASAMAGPTTATTDVVVATILDDSRLATPPIMVLLGSMGVGKTSVGGALASRLGSHFVDLDDVLVQTAGQPIPTLFERLGESGFRRLEGSVAVDTIEGSSERTIVALGGGTYMDYDVRLTCRRRAKTVYLRARPDAVLARLSVDDVSSRPLLSRNAAQALSDRHSARDAVYLRSDIVVNAEGALDDVVEMVLPYA